MSAVVNGINKLSLNRGVENNSTNVVAKIAKIFIINDIGDKINTINDADRKNTVDPSKDLLNISVCPNYIKINAANESDILKTSKLIIATFS